MKLSIVIPVLNSHEILRRQLLFYAGMGKMPDTELIIVDDGSDPPLTADIGIANLRIHRTNDFRPWTWALARNAGARIATGEYLLMYDLDHIVPRFAINFIREFTGIKVQFVREFGVLDEEGRLTQDRDVLLSYGLPKEQGLKIGPLPNNFAMRKDVFWELGGYREDLVEKPYPQGEDRYWRSVWRTYEQKRGGEGTQVCTHRPKIYMFPNGKYCGDVDADPKGLFHTLSRKTWRNGFWRQQKAKHGSEAP